MTGIRKSVFLVALCASAQVHAECPNLFDPAYAGDTGNTDKTFGGGPSDGLVAVAQSLASITAGSDSSTASLKFVRTGSKASDFPRSWPERGSGRGTTLNPESISGCAHALSITVSGPLDNKDNTTEPATLDGLSNAFALKIGYAQYHDVITLAPEKGILDEDSLRVPSTWFWGVSASIGRKEFEYIDFDGFDKATQTERPWSASAFLGIDWRSWVYTARLRVQESYKDQESATQCRPIAGSTNLDCLSGPPGPPAKEDRRQFSVEVRSRIFKRVGVAPSINHDFELDVTGVDFPVYLWQNEKGQLTGGIRAGWRDDTKDTQYSIFISQPF